MSTRFFVDAPLAAQAEIALPSGPARHVQVLRLQPGAPADLVLFDPARVADHATLSDSRRVASGVISVLVNGEIVLRDGAFTGVRSGRFVRGPGHTGSGSSRIGAEGMPRAAG